MDYKYCSPYVISVVLDQLVRLAGNLGSSMPIVVMLIGVQDSLSKANMVLPENLLYAYNGFLTPVVDIYPFSCAYDFYSAILDNH